VVGFQEREWELKVGAQKRKAFLGQMQWMNGRKKTSLNDQGKSPAKVSKRPLGPERVIKERA